MKSAESIDELWQCILALLTSNQKSAQSSKTIGNGPVTLSLRVMETKFSHLIDKKSYGMTILPKCIFHP